MEEKYVSTDSLIPYDKIVRAITEGHSLPTTPEDEAKLLEAETERRKVEFVKKAMSGEFSRKQALFLFELFELLGEREKLLLYQIL